MAPRLAALILLLTARLALATGWSTEAPLGVARQEQAVAELGGRIYALGGLSGLTPLSSVEVWDPGVNAWSSAAPLPTPLHHTAAVGLGGELYVMGGWTDFFATTTPDVWAYDPGANAWSPRAPMPTSRAALAAAALGRRIYAVGGWPIERAADCAVYDPAADAWATCAGLPTPRNHLAAAGLFGLLYAIGGRSALGAGQENVATVEAYAPGSDTWAPVAPLPRARSGLAAATLAPFLISMGGEGNSESADGTFADTDVYDPRQDRWIPVAPLPTPVHGIGAAPLDGRVHVPGGGPVQGFGLTDAHQVYDPASDPGFPIAVPALPPVALALAALALAALALELRRRAGPTPTASARRAGPTPARPAAPATPTSLVPPAPG